MHTYTLTSTTTQTDVWEKSAC